MSYQWYFNTNFPIVGSATSTLTLPAVGTNEAGYYTVVVSNAYGNATSSAAALTVIGNVLSNPTRNTNGTITMTIAGSPNSTNIIWTTINLAQPSLWQPIYTNLNSGASGIWQFTDTNAVNFSERFYRFSTP